MHGFELTGDLKSLRKQNHLAIGNQTLMSRQFDWTLERYVEPQLFFSARFGRSLITSGFLPISLISNTLYLDQSYQNLFQFHETAVSIDAAAGKFVYKGVPEICLNRRAVLIGGSPENNWYHWLLNWLPRLSLFKTQHPEIFHDLNTIFIFHSNASADNYLGTIKQLGVDETRCVFIDPHRGCVVEDLIVPTFGDSNYYFNEYFCLLRDSLGQRNDQSYLPKRFFISRERSASPKRRVVNIAELRSYLYQESIAEVFLEDFSSLVQMQLFANAELVVGVHGAGLSNIIFCRADTHIVLIDNDRNYWVGMSGMFSGLGEIMGHRLTLVLAKEEILDDVDYDSFYNLHNRDVLLDMSSVRNAVSFGVSNVPESLLRKNRDCHASSEI